MANDVAPVNIRVGGLYRHSLAYKKADGTVHLTVPERLPHIFADGTIIHVCSGDETVYDIALLYYGPQQFARPLDLWEIVAQFQPEPLQDPSVPLPSRFELLVPPRSYINEIAFGSPLSETPEI